MGERIRVRVPITSNSSAIKHQQEILEFFRKFILKSNKLQNEKYAKYNHEESNFDSEESSRDQGNFNNLEIFGPSDCAGVALIEKDICGTSKRSCEYEINGIPCELI